jgi:hypothetical protein
MNIKSVSLAIVFSFMAYAMSTIPTCNYTIAKYGGTPCNQLPPPPPNAALDSLCTYY